MLERIAKDSGIKTPTREELTRMERKRKGQKLSNKDWKSESDEDARITKMKDGRTHLAYKPERAVDLDTGAIVSADIHKADQGDTTTIGKTLESARKNLSEVWMHAANHDSDGGHCGQRLPFSGSSERAGWWSLEDKDL